NHAPPICTLPPRDSSPLASNAPPTTHTYTLSLHDALPIYPADDGLMHRPPRPVGEGVLTPRMWRGIVFVGVIMAAGTLFVLDARSEEHTSELQSPDHLVCRLLLEKKK